MSRKRLAGRQTLVLEIVSFVWLYVMSNCYVISSARNDAVARPSGHLSLVLPRVFAALVAVRPPGPIYIFSLHFSSFTKKKSYSYQSTSRSVSRPMINKEHISTPLIIDVKIKVPTIYMTGWHMAHLDARNALHRA